MSRIVLHLLVAAFALAVAQTSSAGESVARCDECGVHYSCGVTMSGESGLFAYFPKNNKVRGYRYLHELRRVLLVFPPFSGDGMLTPGGATIAGLHWVAASIDGAEVYAMGDDRTEVSIFARASDSGRLVALLGRHFDSAPEGRAFMCAQEWGVVVDEQFGRCGRRTGVRMENGEDFLQVSQGRCSD